jgi:hypothetical protein
VRTSRPAPTSKGNDRASCTPTNHRPERNSRAEPNVPRLLSLRREPGSVLAICQAGSAPNTRAAVSVAARTNTNTGRVKAKPMKKRGSASCALLGSFPVEQPAQNGRDAMQQRHAPSYSCCSAIIGSMREARRAGTIDAKAATARSVRDATAIAEM